MDRRMNELDILHGLFYKRLDKIHQKYKKEILPFREVFQKLGLFFTINKKECWQVLLFLKDSGWIEIIPRHGIKLLKNEN